MATYIVTVTASDRVGIVHSVTGTLRDLRGNILELSQTVMRGYFTIILAVEFADERDPKTLIAAIADRGSSFNLTVAVLPANVEPQPPVPNGERFILTVLGTDHPGNIHGIASCLTRSGVNIVDLHARADGDDRFSLVMEAFLPPDLAPGVVRRDLEEFGRELGLEAFVQHENIFVATSEPTPVRVAPQPMTAQEAVVPH